MEHPLGPFPMLCRRTCEDRIRRLYRLLSAFLKDRLRNNLLNRFHMDNLSLPSLVEAVCRTARSAGVFLRSERRNFRPEAVQEKHVHDYVSYVDRESERRIVQQLHAILPEAGFITEEGSADYRDQPYCWVVDPLDGTTNYIHDNAPYCVSIALRDRQTLLAGVVYDPCRDECFYAWKGGGAYVDGRRLHVSAVHRLEDAFAVVELPYDAGRYASTGLHLIRAMYGRVAGIRMNGSAALAICYVAAGRFDTWQEAYIGRWDYSAAALMVMEAGGRVTDFRGNDHFMDGHHVVATNGLLHGQVLQLLAEAMPEL